MGARGADGQWARPRQGSAPAPAARRAVGVAVRRATRTMLLRVLLPRRARMARGLPHRAHLVRAPNRESTEHGGHSISSPFDHPGRSTKRCRGVLHNLARSPNVRPLHCAPPRRCQIERPRGERPIGELEWRVVCRRAVGKAGMSRRPSLLLAHSPTRRHARARPPRLARTHEPGSRGVRGVRLRPRGGRRSGARSARVFVLSACRCPCEFLCPRAPG